MGKRIAQTKNDRDHVENNDSEGEDEYKTDPLGAKEDVDNQEAISKRK